jgi:hypothetical protein
MIEVIHTILHTLGICPDSIGFVMWNNYVTILKHYLIIIKNYIL